MAISLPSDEVLQIIAKVLGGNVDDAAAYFISTGPAAKRNALLTTERIITRAINTLNDDLVNVKTGTNNFTDRFNSVIGMNSTTDKVIFDEIGSNLIIAVREIQKQIVELDDKPGYSPTAEEKLVLESGITKDLIDGILDNLTNIFTPTISQLDSINSEMTKEKLDAIIDDIEMLKDNMIPIDDETIDELCANAFTTI